VAIDTDAVRTPANRLTPAERTAILTVANPAEFAHRSPHQSVPALADQGRDLASESTFYRVLQAADRSPVASPRRPARATGTADGHRPQSGLELGHHVSQHDGARDVLLSLPDHGGLQSQACPERRRRDRRLGGLPQRIRRTGRQRLPQGPSARGGARRYPGAAFGQRRAHERRHQARHLAAPGRRALLQPTLGQR